VVEYRILTNGGTALLSKRVAERLARAANTALRRANSDGDRTVSLVIVGPLRMTTLGRRMGKSAPTDVLAFPMDPPMLGEIFLCPSEVRKRAVLWGRTPALHARYLFVHGLLHLYGYDHEGETEARRMERLERKIVEYVL